MTGTRHLVRLILRRDRVVLPLWVILLGLLPAGYAVSFDGLLPTAADRIDYARVSAGNAGFVALYGPLQGSGLAELVVWRSGFLPVLIALFALLTVVRHTRADEEAGRTDLIGAGVVGRHAQLAAALLVTAGAGVLLGVITTLAMIGQGLAVAGSVWFGVEFLLSVWAFAGVAAITVQLTSSARGARSIALAVLAAAYVLRLAGDISAVGSGALSWLSWLSPIGWVQHIFPYGGNHWWPAVLTVLFAAATTWGGVILLGHRDVGGGLLADRLGPVSAAPGLRSPLALAWRLHRGLLAGWAVGFALLGLVFGAVGDSVVDLAEGNTSLGDILGRISGASVLVDSYFGAIAGMVGLIAAGYAVQATLRMRDEETSGHAEMVLGTATGRSGWAASHLLFVLLGPALVLAVEALVAGLTYGLISGDVGGRLPGIVGGVLTQIPAVWTLAAIAVVLFGVLPRLAPLAWGALAGCVLVLLVGGTLRLDQWVLDISPFTHVPRLPGGDVPWTSLVVLTVLAAGAIGGGLAALRRRDIPVG